MLLCKHPLLHRENAVYQNEILEFCSTSLWNIPILPIGILTFARKSWWQLILYTAEFIPQFLHNKPASHNCPIIVTMHKQQYVPIGLWKAGLLCKNGRKYPAVYRWFWPSWNLNNNDQETWTNLEMPPLMGGVQIRVQNLLLYYSLHEISMLIFILFLIIYLSLLVGWQTPIKKGH